MVEPDNVLSNRDVEIISELNVKLMSAVCVWVIVDIKFEETLDSSKLTKEFTVTTASAETELVVIEVTGVLMASVGVGDIVKAGELDGRESIERNITRSQVTLSTGMHTTDSGMIIDYSFQKSGKCYDKRP